MMMAILQRTRRAVSVLPVVLLCAVVVTARADEKKEEIKEYITIHSPISEVAPDHLATGAPGDGMVWDIQRVLRDVKAPGDGLWPELEVADLSGYENTCATGAGKVTANCDHFAKEGPENVFDGSPAKWCARVADVRVDYAYGDGKPRSITAYALTSANDRSQRDPKHWRLSGSSDGTSWTVVDERKDECFLSRHHTRLFELENPACYSHFRFEVLANHGEEITQLEELQLLIPGAPKKAATQADIDAALVAAGKPEGYKPLFADDLGNAQVKKGAWTLENGVLTAKGGGDIWTKAKYGDFALDLEFKCAENTNSGVFVRCRSISEWLHTAIEVQVLQPQTGNNKHNCGAIFDVLAPTKRAVKPVGEWNHYQIVAKGSRILVTLNGERVNDIDLDKWTEAGKNPDGSKNKFKYAYSTLARVGHIGLQYHGQPITYRNVKIKEL